MVLGIAIRNTRKNCLQNRSKFLKNLKELSGSRTKNHFIIGRAPRSTSDSKNYQVVNSIIGDTSENIEINGGDDI